MMPKLPDELDTRFNFYLNLLPLVNPLGFWGALVLGVGLLVYAITRATLHMSSFTRQATNISDGKYARANLLQNLTGSGGIIGNGNQVYNPCELKLLDDVPTAKKHVIIRGNSDEEAYQERRQSAYALELEPALSDAESSDEGNESDTVTLSRNSTTSSSCIEVEHDDDDICIDCFDDNGLEVTVDAASSSSSSSGSKTGAKHQVSKATINSYVICHIERGELDLSVRKSSPSCLTCLPQCSSD